MSEFQKFPKIEQIGRLYMSITQKLHGTHGNILIEREQRPDDREVFIIRAGGRNRWLSLEDDNYGFCRWVYDNQAELISKLGCGRHYGEWCGSGINTGEGLTGKHFYLFNWRRWRTMPLLPNVGTVPVLYTGRFSLEKIEEVMADLKQTGSRIVDGYMKTEGIVIELDGKLYKKVFDREDTKWDKPERLRSERIDKFDASPYLQPLRLEKLISRDEKYQREYPASLPQIVKDYMKDLIDEGQITGTEDEIAEIRKCASRHIFNFVKDKFNEIGL